MYCCPRCGYISDLKNNIKRHLNRKSICIVIHKNVSIEKCIIMLNEGKLKEKKEKRKYKCDICDKFFDRKSRLNSHTEKCNIEILNIVKEQQKQIKQLIEINKSSGVNNDNSTNYTNCGNINININPFKDTDYGALKDEIIKCLENQDTKLKVPMFEQIIGIDYYPTLERTDIKTATLKAYIDPEKFKKLVGADFDCIEITARLDKIGQVSPIIPKAYKNNSYSSGYS